MAEIFSLANRDRDARTDAFFGPAATRLVANYLRAAALAGQPLTQVYLWLCDHTDSEPADILREHGCELAAKAVLADVHAPEEQRGGVFGGAQGICSFMLNDPVMRWVTPVGPPDRRPRFDPEQFVTSTDTLYSMSREGAGSAAALVAWLTVAIMDAAERHATSSPHGRLATPLVAVLDEAANVVRWPDLPNRYSHYGSKGILPLVLLQSWPQGVEVWGQHGMGKLWGSSNIRIYGGGSADAEFLRQLSQLVGNVYLPQASRSYNSATGPGQTGGRSINVSLQQHQILDVADLASLPKGRIVLFATGTRPVLAKRIPFWEMPYAEQVNESIRRYGPGQAPAAPRTAAPAAAGNPWVR